MNRLPRSIWLAALILSVSLYLLPYKGELKHLGPDTLEYLSFSDLFLSSRPSLIAPADEVPKGAVVRPPGYPALLSLGRAVFPNDLRAAVLSVNALLGWLSGMAICLGFRAYVPPAWSALLLSLSFVHLRPWYNGIATEWTTYTMVLGFLSAAVMFFRAPTPARLALWACVAAFLPWVRPNFILAALLPACSVIALPRGRRTSGALAFTLGLVPLLALMTLSYVRFGVFKPTPYGGRNLFIAGTLSGTATALPIDSPTFQRFIELVNHRLAPISATERLSTEREPGFEDFQRRYLANFYMVEDIGKDLGIDLVELDRFAGVYGVRAITTHLINYCTLQRVWYGWLVANLIIFVPMIILLKRWSTEPRYHPLCLAASSLFALHLLQMVTVITTQPPLERYMIPTYYPLVYCLMLVSTLFLVSLLSVRDSRRRPLTAPAEHK